jgi:hypothetical protein
MAPPIIQYAGPENVPLPLIGRRGIWVGVGVGADSEDFFELGWGVLVGVMGTGVLVGVMGTGVLVGVTGTGVSVGEGVSVVSVGAGTKVGVEVKPRFAPAAKVGRSVMNASESSRTMTDMITPAVIHILVLVILFSSQSGSFITRLSLAAS